MTTPMTTYVPQSQADIWEQRLDILSRMLFAVLLAVASILAVLQAPFSWAAVLTTLGLAGLVGAWMTWFIKLRPFWALHPAAAVIAFAGLVIGVAALLTRSPWFGLLAIPCYDLAFTHLPGSWRIAGIVTVSGLAAMAVRGGIPAGLPPLTFSDIAVYALTLALYAILGGGFTFIGHLTSTQSQQRKHLVADLAEANRQLELIIQENEGLHAQLLAQAREAGVLDERQRMAREIHDTLAQGFIGIIAQLEAAKQAGEQPARWKPHLEQAQQLARESLAEARRSVQALQPEPLDDAQLPDAIARLAHRWAETNAIALTAQTIGTPQPLPSEVEATLFRVAQEALANVAKHAQASRVGVTVSYLKDVVLLDIRDDGVGFVPGAVASHDSTRKGECFGLTAMRQRVRHVAGTLTIESAPGEGTAINVSVPLLASGGDRP